jgi:hypothetical protein
VLLALMNPIKPDPDLAKVRATFESAAPAGGWQTYLQTVFNEEESRLAASQIGGGEEFLRDFPSKRGGPGNLHKTISGVSA